jgi:predicted transcriptional regulator
VSGGQAAGFDVALAPLQNGLAIPEPGDASMTSMPLSAKLQKLIAREMAAGKYKSREDLMLQALDALAERRAAIKGIERGLADMKAGRMRPWRECRRGLLNRHSDLAEQ